MAAQLPRKSRRLHPRVMPESQVVAYDAARLTVTRGRGGLKALHHIRSVSVHPDLALRRGGSDFVGDSARIDATFDVIRHVRDRGERALVFIEHRLVQYQFVEVARREFGLPRIDIINGSTPIRQRQLIVERFQRHLDEDGGFDLLVLGTRAAGTGLTLTAATHVIHVSRWWNPAVEEQCNDRVHRIGQDRAVTVHVPMAVHPAYREHSFDCLLHSLMSRKRKLADSALWPMGDTEIRCGGTPTRHGQGAGRRRHGRRCLRCWSCRGGAGSYVRAGWETGAGVRRGWIGGVRVKLRSFWNRPSAEAAAERLSEITCL